MPHNASSPTAKRGRRGSVAEEMDAYDALPPKVRHTLRNCVFPWIPSALQPAYFHCFSTLVDDFERELIAKDAAAWQKENGAGYPHIAAGATILRTTEPTPPQRRRPRYA